MTEDTYLTPYGEIHYWVNKRPSLERKPLVFLPGLTADHRLFSKQIEYFSKNYPLLVWDAPGHASSWPFELTFSLMDKARWLDEILEKEGLRRPILIGQSMGGYVGQAFMEQFPENVSGFIAIDSAPLQRQYVTGIEIWLLKRMEPVYRFCPWNFLLSAGPRGCAVSEYGRALMREMMMTYDHDKGRYAKLSGHGFWMLAEAMEADLPYRISCPALLICGRRDRAGATRRYNKAWQKNSEIPLEWVEDAGHNSNTDQPEVVNTLIERFLESVSIDKR